QESPTGGKAASIEVRWAGSLKQVMLKGDLTGTIDLQALTKLKNVYAAGALAGLDGEVTILDSAMSIARVQNGQVVVSQLGQGKACVLVYAQVQVWRELLLPETARSLGHLEEFVVEAASKQGIDVTRPFPFLVRGTVAEAKYHVVRHPGDVADLQELHDRA